MENYSIEQERNEAELVNVIYDLRSEMNDRRLFVIQDEIVKFDKELKKFMTENFGGTQLLQQVPAWQALVGGTLEGSPTINQELKKRS